MFSRHNSRTLALATLLVFGAFSTVNASLGARVPPQSFKVTAVSLTASPPVYQGPCPGVIKFAGTITANGSGVVKYTFLRSDGAIAPTSSLRFDEPGTKTVEITWILGSSYLPEYSGWEALQILSPNSMTSKKANFRLVCDEPDSKAGR